MQVVDHLPDRYVVRIEDQTGDVLATFLAVQDSQLANRAGTGMIPWNGSQNSGQDPNKRYIRGWIFPEQKLALEFVYSKAEAVDIAQANHTRVAAIDPSSDGLVVHSGLSKEDLQIVTLWMLTPTYVGMGDKKPGIAAAKYDHSAEERQAAQADQFGRTLQAMSVTAPPPTPVLAASTAPQPRAMTARERRLEHRRELAEQKQAAREAREIKREQLARDNSTQHPRAAPETQVAQLEPPPLPTSGRRPMATRLPHTASNIYLVWLLGMMAMTSALRLRLKAYAAGTKTTDRRVINSAARRKS